jgi:hypothetical protein
MSLAFLPVIAAFFVGLAIMEIATKVPFYKYIIHDVSGIETIKAILFGQIEVPRLPLWSDWLFSMILIVSLIVGVIISFRVISKLIFEWNISRNREIMYAVPVIFILLIFCGALAYQLF